MCRTLSDYYCAKCGCSQVNRPYATIRATEEKICDFCAHIGEANAIENDAVIFCYLGSDVRGQRTPVTGWTGNVLGYVTYACTTYRFGNKMVSVRVVTPKGRRLYGIGLGSGMYIRLRPFKNQK